MIERLQADSDLNLGQHQKDVAGALHAMQKPAGSAPSGDAGLAIEMVASMFCGGLFGAALTVYNDLHSAPSEPSLFVNGSPRGRKGRANSLFVGGGGNRGVAVTKATHERMPLVPVSAKDKRKLDRDSDVYARGKIASLSLTGGSLADSRFVEIKGPAVSVPSVRGFTYATLTQELGNIQKVKKDPYARGTKRLFDDLKKGVDGAELFVTRTPTLKIENFPPKSGPA